MVIFPYSVSVDFDQDTVDDKPDPNVEKDSGKGESLLK
jgi:hypothetical protein